MCYNYRCTANFKQKRKKICHEGKPVAVREKLFKILTKAHRQCQHGGRDKTSAHVRRTYSWQVGSSDQNYVPWADRLIAGFPKSSFLDLSNSARRVRFEEEQAATHPLNLKEARRR